MAKSKVQAAPEAHASSFLGFARQYQKAANLLYEADNTLNNPIYFRYMHAIELALKAYLRASEVSIVGGKRKHHQVAELNEECGKLGLAWVRMTISIVVMYLFFYSAGERERRPRFPIFHGKRRGDS